MTLPRTLPKETFPIYHISYGTSVRSVNDAIVSASSPENAKSLLEKYLLENPLNEKYPQSSLPDVRIDCKELEFRATTPGVIYCSLDTQRE
jgi:hypothetical protein